MEQDAVVVRHTVEQVIVCLLAARCRSGVRVW